MDVNTHVRAVWRHKWFVLLTALAFGLLVLLVRSLPPTAYTVSAGLYLTPGADMSAADVARLTDVYAEFDDSALVLRETVDALPDADLGREQVRAATGVSALSDGLLQATATAPSAERAAVLANAYGAALGRAVAADQQRAQSRALEPLDAQLALVSRELRQLTPAQPDFRALEEQRGALVASRAGLLARSLARLDVLTAAQPSQAVATPRPRRDALLAFLVSLIVVSELLVLRAVRQGRLDGIGLTGALERLSGLPVVRVGRRGDQSAGLLSLVLTAEAPTRGAAVKLLPLDPTPTAQVAPYLVAEAALRAGRNVLMIETARRDDVAGDDPGHRLGVRTLRLRPSELAQQARAGRPIQAGLDDLVVVALPSWDAPELLAVAPLPATALLVVDARVVRSRNVEEALKVLRLAGTAAEFIVLVDLSRRTARRIRSGWAPTPRPPLQQSAGPLAPRATAPS